MSAARAGQRRSPPRCSPSSIRWPARLRVGAGPVPGSGPSGSRVATDASASAAASAPRHRLPERGPDDASCRPRAARSPALPPQPERPLTGVGRILPAVQRAPLAGQPVVQPGGQGRAPRRRRTAAPARTGPPPRGASRGRPPGRQRRAHSAAPPGRRRPPRRGRPAGRRRRSPRPRSAVEDPDVDGSPRRSAGMAVLHARAGRSRGGTSAPAPSPASSPTASRSRRPATGQPGDRLQQRRARPGRRSAPPRPAPRGRSAPSRATRARTASRAEGGTSPIPDCTTSVT